MVNKFYKLKILRKNVKLGPTENFPPPQERKLVIYYKSSMKALGVQTIGPLELRLKSNSELLVKCISILTGFR